MWCYNIIIVTVSFSVRCTELHILNVHETHTNKDETEEGGGVQERLTHSPLLTIRSSNFIKKILMTAGKNEKLTSNKKRSHTIFLGPPHPNFRGRQFVNSCIYPFVVFRLVPAYQEYLYLLTLQASPLKVNDNGSDTIFFLLS